MKGIIKLGLLKEGEGTVFRRLSWDPEAIQEGDRTLTEKLKDLAVQLFSQDESVNMDDYTVLLSFFDRDGDKILLFTEEEVDWTVDEELVRGAKSSVKIFAAVSLKPEGSSARKAPPSTSSRATTATQTPDDSSTIVDSLADLITCAAVSVHAGVTAAKGASKTQMKQAKQISKDSLKLAKSASKEGIKLGKQSIKLAKAASKHHMQSSKALARPEVRPEVPPPTPPMSELEFIHGRHTCDQCLNTPIVGKRFHAANLPDYDLCEACHDNYQGTEITFEEAKLERDIPFQVRWNRKYAKVMRGGHRRGGPRPWRHGPHPRGPHLDPGHQGPPPGPPPHHAHPLAPCESGHSPSDPPHPHHHGPPHPHHRGPPHPHHHGPPPPFHLHPPCGPPPPFHHHPHRGPFGPHSRGLRGCPRPDAAMEEAIRRSLADEKAIADEVTEKAEVSAEEPDILVEPVKQPEEPDIVVESVKQETVSDTTKEIESTSDCKEADLDDDGLSECKPDPEAEGGDDILDAGLQFGEDDSAVEEEDVSTKVHVTKAVEKSDSVKEDDSVKNSSFATEAAGEGDVATFVGETLDRMASAIDKLTADSSDDEDSDDDESTSDNSGAKIVDGEEDDDFSKGSWSVVADDDDQVAHDNQIANAAAVIGSALFNSDNNVSVLTPHTADGVSVVSSVPTSVRSISNEVPQAQLERWSVQLQKLRELGFINDVLCVDALESLHAANVGVDSDDEVSVEQVIDKLMKHW